MPIARALTWRSYRCAPRTVGCYYTYGEGVQLRGTARPRPVPTPLRATSERVPPVPPHARYGRFSTATAGAADAAQLRTLAAASVRRAGQCDLGGELCSCDARFALLRATG